MNVGTRRARTRATSRRIGPVAIAFAAASWQALVVFQVSGIAAPERTPVQQRLHEPSA